MYTSYNRADIAEFGAAVRKLCPEITERQLRHLMKHADEDGSGTLERDEFVEFLTQQNVSTESIDSNATGIKKSTFKFKEEFHEADRFYSNFLKLVKNSRSHIATHDSC
jgi:hypothetical protein